MGKPTTTKKTTPKKGGAKVAPPAPLQSAAPAADVVAKPKRARLNRTAEKAPAVEPVVIKRAATSKVPRKKVSETTRTFSGEEIALRAYFIAEKRQQAGQWGTPEGDWLEAERQLLAELGRDGSHARA